MNLSYPYPVENKKERIYIQKRRIKAFVNSLCFYICRIFPIKEKLVSICTFEGKGGFGCNPKYIVLELHKRYPEYEFVWFVNDMDKEFPDYIRKVPNTLWSRAYWLSRSKIWIDNYRKPFETRKRKGQYYLNTNHYTVGIKTVGLWRERGFSKMAYLVSKNDSDMIDDLVIDSKFCEQMCPRGLIYEGNYLKTGAPRCDVLYGDKRKYKEEFIRKHNLPENAKIIMFAPTFREGAKNGKRSVYLEKWTIDLPRLIQNMEKKFGGIWYVCIRVHPQLAAGFRGYENADIKNRVIDESQADDMYRILAGMDAYITDYSSACFEAGIANIPVFLYIEDLKDYEHSRNLFWEMADNKGGRVSINKSITPDIDAELPFSIAGNNDELQANIEKFDLEDYKKDVAQMMSALDMVFDGTASKKIAETIAERTKGCMHK